jgi:hypothetical protein
VSESSMRAKISARHGNCTDSRKASRRQQSEAAHAHGKPRVREKRVWDMLR